jgi:pyruvate dehydrogenase E2 component (dihydrolipoamide acetyltransferase)
VDEQPLDALMASLADLVARCRVGSLRSSELSEAGITLTNLGDTGVESVFGVIYPPQVALVGFGRIAERPCVVDGTVRAWPTVVASLAADHRASDGHRGAVFLAEVRTLLQQPDLLDTPAPPPSPVEGSP